jgi:hypothetical protein
MRGGQFWAALILFLGMTASLFTWQALRTREHRLLEVESEVAAQECVHAVEKSLLLHLEAVYAIAHYVAVTPRLATRARSP